MVLTRKRAKETSNEEVSGNPKKLNKTEIKKKVSNLQNESSQAAIVPKDKNQKTSHFFKPKLSRNNSSVQPQPCSSSSINIDANESSRKDINDSSDSDSEVDWDQVPEIPHEPSLEDYNPIIPENGVEITVEAQTLNKDRRKRKKEFDLALYARRRLNRFKKDVQIESHKVHLLCWIGHGFYLNRVLNSDIIRGLALSLITENLSANPSEVTFLFVRKFLKYFSNLFSLQLEKKNNFGTDLLDDLKICFSERKVNSVRDFCLIFISLARALNLEVRLCFAAYPISFKPTDLIKSKNEDSKSVKIVEADSKKRRSNSAKPAKNCDSNRTRRSVKKLNYKEDEEDSDGINKSNVEKLEPKLGGSSEDISLSETDSDDFALKSNRGSKKGLESNLAKRKSIKIVSSESAEEMEDVKRSSVDYWVEIFASTENKWICIDVVKGLIDKPNEIEGNMLRLSSYLIGIDDKFYIRDVTKKYAANWLTFSRKQRVDPDWWDETMEMFKGPDDHRYLEEEKQIQATLVDKPLPKTVGEFKKHPLYALKRHLLKFEGIYPPDSPSLGFIRSEPIYARECVRTLHSREIWMKQAKVVKRNEIPYKIVKARPKWDKMSGDFKTDLPLEIFGSWQTEDYIPPPAKDGKVPRNEYGNIELFQPSMLPAGTVHLQLPGLNRIARKLGLDCAPALVGFDSHGVGAHPVFDGFVVCSEHKEVFLAAWDEEQENIRKREEEKREKRVYDNWKKLIKGVLIREKIKLKYGDK